MLYFKSFVSCFVVTTESCNGGIVKNGTNQTIVDSNNETWIIDYDDKIYKNRKAAGDSSEVVLLVYWNQVIYQENRYGGWWKWVKDSPPWEKTSDPRPSSHSYTESGCPLGPLPGSCTRLFNKMSRVSDRLYRKVSFI